LGGQYGLDDTLTRQCPPFVTVKPDPDGDAEAADMGLICSELTVQNCPDWSAHSAAYGLMQDSAAAVPRVHVVADAQQVVGMGQPQHWPHTPVLPFAVHCVPMLQLLGVCTWLVFTVV